MAKRGPKSRYENLRFVAPTGTRDFYRKAAELAGGFEHLPPSSRLRAWMRETLHKEALRLHEEHGIKGKPPEVHPKPPPPLQER